MIKREIKHHRCGGLTDNAGITYEEQKVRLGVVCVYFMPENAPSGGKDILWRQENWPEPKEEVGFGRQTVLERTLGESRGQVRFGVGQDLPEQLGLPRSSSRG